MVGPVSDSGYETRFITKVIFEYEAKFYVTCMVCHTNLISYTIGAIKYGGEHFCNFEINIC